MKPKPIVLIAMLCFSVFTLSQTNARFRDEETEFNADLALKDPVPLPPEVLVLLEKDGEKENCTAGTYDRIDASWVSATRIILQPGAAPALLVRGEKGCFIGANTTEYRVYEKNASGWNLIFSDRALALTLLPLIPGKHRKIATNTALQAGRWVDTRTFTFRNGKYVLIRELSEEINP